MRHTPLMKSAHPRREAALAAGSYTLTIILYFMLGDTLLHKVYDSYFFPNLVPFYGGLIYLAALVIVFYSSSLYHLCLVGNYLRQLREKMATAEEVQTIFDHPAPRLTVLIPSYKEERVVIWQTMMSAALSEYPAKRVVLLIDNPPNPKHLADQTQLQQARALPVEMEASFAEQAAIYHQAQGEYRVRAQGGAIDLAAEAAVIASLHERVAQWLEQELLSFTGGISLAELPFDARFFVETILMAPAALHREKAQRMRDGIGCDEAAITHAYAFLAGLFTVTFSSFERKKYSNLSHDANKAMNLNSYIMLVGKAWRELPTEKGLELHECAPEDAAFQIPATDYINTIDADSLMTHDYVSRLVHFMQQPEHAQVAVAQAPCSAIPGSPVPIERTAGACIDVQYHTHQGYTYWYASFWVGANAMLRMTALDAICEVQMVNGHPIAIYIQDRTVIEDTESTIDLVHKGWRLYNYPARMTFSATPADFGSLLIQRRRWANGGLIILPKLLRYAYHAPKNWRLAKELFMRFNYLAMTTLSVAVMLLFAFYSFSPRLSSPLLIYANLPLLFLYARDLKVCGYRYRDIWAVTALNLMLLPILMAGVFKQLQQIVTGRKVPFGRTPKVKDRTGAPAIYYLLELAMIGYCAYMAIDYGLEQEWSQVAYAGVNLALLSYAMIRFIGIRPMAIDLWAAFRRVVLRKQPEVG